MNDTFWDKRAKKYDDAIQKHGPLFDKSISRTRALLNRSDMVLDFGCASGEVSLTIAPHVQRVHGIDTSGKMIDLANEKARIRQIDNTVFDQMDPFDPSLVKQSFSAIIAFDIIHLIDDVHKVLARLNDLLVTGGMLITQTPAFGERGWFIRLLIGLAQKVGIAPYICSLTPTEIELLVSSSEFDIVDSEVWDSKNAVQWIVARKK